MKELEKIIPYIELNDRKYEIKTTRYLLAEYEKEVQRNQFSNEMQSKAAKSVSLSRRVAKYSEKLEELENRYLETFDEEDKRKYLSMQSLYDEAYNALLKDEAENVVLRTAQKTMLDMLEQIAIKGLAEQHFDGDYEKGKSLWEQYVEVIGESEAVEWLFAMQECLFTKENKESENSFLAKMRARKK